MAQPLCLIGIFFVLAAVAQATILFTGITPLNADNFDKVVPRFKVALVRFEEAGPEHKRSHVEFLKVAEDSNAFDDLLVGDVQIDDMGKDINTDIAARFNVVRKDFPAYKLFLQGQDRPTNFTGDPNYADEVKKFVFRESGIWMGLSSCIDDFEKMVEDFFKKSGNDRKAVLEKIRKAASDVTKEAEKQRAEIYIKALDKIVATGNKFISEELERVKLMTEKKIDVAKRIQLNHRSNILTSIQRRIRDEL